MQTDYLKEFSNKELLPPIFVVGCARSGTTLLANTIGKHSNIYNVKEETHLFYNLKNQAILDKLERTNDIETLTLVILTRMFYLVTPEEFMQKKIYLGEKFPEIIKIFKDISSLEEFKTVSTRFDIFDLCATFLTLKENKIRWVEKTPFQIFNVPFILEIYPNAKFIEIYRDPRAVYHSWNNVNHSYFKKGKPIQCSSIWRRAITNGQKLKQFIPKQYYQIKYEDLVNLPEKELIELCDFLGEKFEPAMLNVEVRNTFFGDIKEKSGFSKIPVNRWEKGLTGIEKIFIDLRTKEFRKNLNYPDSGTKISITAILPFTFYLLTRGIVEIEQIKSLSIRKFSKRLLFIKTIKNNIIDFSHKIRSPVKIKTYLKLHPIKMLQVGSGSNILPGWLNTDSNPCSNNIVFLDSTKKFPFKNNTFDYIFSEHHIEHLSYFEGLHMLKECYRILKPKGKIRIATPDLKVFIDLYNPQKSNIQKRYINFISNNYNSSIGIQKDIIVINSIFKNFGHKFVYDFEILKMTLEKVGFINVTFFKPQESNDDFLKGIEYHGKYYKTLNLKYGEDFNCFETMVLEALRL
ncbi:MAG: sulfotransferase [Candidatus Melainabacteria bacterium]|nr:sulfotransferase [Candidatus Melainabacteria bacterium]